MNVNVYISHNEQIQIHVNVRAYFRYCIEMNINVQYNHRKGKSPSGIHRRINPNMKGDHTMNRTTKYLIPTLKPNQFAPIRISGEWVYIPATKTWICHNATPRYYSDLEISAIALIDNLND